MSPSLPGSASYRSSEAMFESDLKTISSTLYSMSISESEYCKMFHSQILGLLSHVKLFVQYQYEARKSLAK